jgi:hypothetical protein
MANFWSADQARSILAPVQSIVTLKALLLLPWGVAFADGPAPSGVRVTTVGQSEGSLPLRAAARTSRSPRAYGHWRKRVPRSASHEHPAE